MNRKRREETHRKTCAKIQSLWNSVSFKCKRSDDNDVVRSDILTTREKAAEKGKKKKKKLRD